MAFAEQGYKIDSACSDVCRARFWSYDPAPYFNLEARKFTGLPKPKPERRVYVRDTERPTDLAMQAAEYLIKNRVPLECTYANFMRITFACKSEWGEAGKDIALDILHGCTTFAQSNTARNFDTLWRNAKRENGPVITGGSIVHWATSAPNSRFGKRTQERPAPAPQQPTIQKNEVVLTDGYPAAWDLPTPTPSSSAARTLVESSEVLALRFDGVFPLDENEAKAWATSRQRAKAILSRATSAANIDRHKKKLSPSKQQHHATQL